MKYVDGDILKIENGIKIKEQHSKLRCGVLIGNY